MAELNVVGVDPAHRPGEGLPFLDLPPAPANMARLARGVRDTLTGPDPSNDVRLSRCVMAALTLGVVGGGILAYSLLNKGKWISVSGASGAGGLLLVAWAADQDRRAFAQVRRMDKSLKKKMEKVDEEEYALHRQQIYEASGRMLGRLLRYLPESEAWDIDDLQRLIDRTHQTSKRIWLRSLPMFSLVAIAAVVSAGLLYKGTPVAIARGTGGLFASFVGVSAIGLSTAARSTRQQLLRDGVKRLRDQVIAHRWNRGELVLPERRTKLHSLRVVHSNDEGREERRPVTVAELEALAAHEVEKLEIDASLLGNADMEHLRGHPLKTLLIYNNRDIDGDGLARLNTIYLKRLRLPRVTGALEGHYGTLERIEVGRANAAGFEGIRTLPSVTELTIRRLEGVVPTVRDLPESLERFTLERLRPVDGATEDLEWSHRKLSEVTLTRADAESLEALSQLTRLRQIKITRFHGDIPEGALNWALEPNHRDERWERIELADVQRFTWETIRQLGDGRRVVVVDAGHHRTLESAADLEAHYNDGPHCKVIFKEHPNPLGGMMGG